MILNSRSWDIRLRISRLDISDSHNIDGSPIISATSVKGALRSFLERFGNLTDIDQDLFGSERKASRLLISDLRLDPAIAQPEPQLQLRTSLSRMTGAAESGTLYKRQILDRATFRGTFQLKNGGVNPAVTTYHYLSKALPDIKLGRGQHLGFGSVETCHLRRSDSDSEILLNPVENIFRKAGHEIIRQIAARPDLIYSLEWRDLERVIALSFEEIGYQVKLTQGSQDGGKDIILYCVSGRDANGKSLDYYVEIKHWKKGAKVGKGAIKKLVEVSIYDAVAGTAFISTSGYADNVNEETFGSISPKLGDLSTIRTLCQYFVASRTNKLFTTKSLEELLNTNWHD